MKHIRPITPVRASALSDFWASINRAFGQYFEDKKAELNL